MVCSLHTTKLVICCSLEVHAWDIARTKGSNRIEAGVVAVVGHAASMHPGHRGIGRERGQCDDSESRGSGLGRRKKNNKRKVGVTMCSCGKSVQRRGCVPPQGPVSTLAESCVAALQVLGIVRVRGCLFAHAHAKDEVANRKQLL